MVSNNPLAPSSNPYQGILATAFYQNTGRTDAPAVTRGELDRFIEQLNENSQSARNGDSKLYWQQQLDAALYLSSHFDVLAGLDGDESSLSLEDIAAMPQQPDPGAIGARPASPSGGGERVP